MLGNTLVLLQTVSLFCPKQILIRFKCKIILILEFAYTDITAKFYYLVIFNEIINKYF